MLKNDQEIVKKPKNHDFIPGYRFSVPTPLKDCQADRDPDDLQRAVNVYAYHSFKHETYKFIARQHGVVSLRFEHVEPPVQPKRIRILNTIGVNTIKIPYVPYSNMLRENVLKGSMV